MARPHTIGDILTVGPRGFAVLAVDGYPYRFELPNHVRDWHPMPWIQKQFVGGMTPAMTWRNGIAVNETLLPIQSPAKLVEMILHETVHWWELWRRMGPTDFPATYGWQGVIRLLRHGSAHLHERHIQEVVARKLAFSMLSDAAVGRFPMTADGLLDVGAWFAVYFPAQRT